MFKLTQASHQMLDLETEIQHLYSTILVPEPGGQVGEALPLGWQMVLSYCGPSRLPVAHSLSRPYLTELSIPYGLCFIHFHFVLFCSLFLQSSSPHVAQAGL